MVARWLFGDSIIPPAEPWQGTLLARGGDVVVMAVGLKRQGHFVAEPERFDVTAPSSAVNGCLIPTTFQLEQSPVELQ